MEGWIKLHRSILNWEWWGDKNTMAVWLWILLHTYYEDGRYRGVEIKRGECPYSVPQIMADLNMTEKEVRTAIKHLKGGLEGGLKGGMKKYQFSIIKVNNFERYQNSPEGRNEGRNEGQNIYRKEGINSFGGGGHYHSSSPKKKKSVMDDYPDVTM